MGYLTVGYVSSENEAKRIVCDGGEVEGEGWPISKGETKPLYKYQEVNKFNL